MDSRYERSIKSNKSIDRKRFTHKWHDSSREKFTNVWSSYQIVLKGWKYTVASDKGLLHHNHYMLFYAGMFEYVLEMRLCMDQTREFQFN